jgi:RNA polymerase sigma-70 factor (ECF subfamily)
VSTATPTVPSWKGIHTARTDADGKYSIDDLGPFDAEAFREREEARQKRALAAADGKTDAFVVFPRQLVVAASHPGLANKQVFVEHVPGKADIQMDSPAVIEGRVVYGDTGKPAAEIAVKAFATLPAKFDSQSMSRHQPFSATTHTDRDGHFRFANLPAGAYDIWPQADGWLNAGIGEVPTSAAKTTTLADFSLSRGGKVKVRLINQADSKPISLDPADEALLSASPPKRLSGRPFISHQVKPQADGSFEIPALIGKNELGFHGLMSDGSLKWVADAEGGIFTQEIQVSQGEQVKVDVLARPVESLTHKRADKQSAEPKSNKDQGAKSPNVKTRFVQNTKPTANQADTKRPPAILSYDDGKPDGKKSYGGSGHLIRFELPDGVTKVRGIRIHGSRYGLPEAPKEDFEITFLSENRDETLHSEAAPYHLFNRGKENWVRVMFDKEVELPKKFWIALNFNPHQTKGVYLSYDTSTKGKYSRVGLPGDEEEPKETDFGGDWMVQVMLSVPK